MARTSQEDKAEVKVDDLFLVARAKQGDSRARNQLIRRYFPFVRLKASSYFLAGGDTEDLLQEGLLGLFKAIRDFQPHRESSFRSFAELCITRQIITAVKTATRKKHAPLNQYVSFSHTPAVGGEEQAPLEQLLPGPQSFEPFAQVACAEELEALVDCLTTALSELESRVLAMYIDGASYELIARRLGCSVKTVDNALQRVKRKVASHLESRALAA